MTAKVFTAAAALVLLIAMRSTADAEDKIRVGISSSSPGFLPTVIAEKKGFFARHGLSSEHIRISLAVAMNALGTGDLDYAVTMAQGVSAAVQGVPVKLVMMTQDKLVFFLMTKTNIQKVADLKGKVICISYFGSTTQLVADVIARQNGFTPGQEIKIIPCGDDLGRFVSLEQGRVDGVIGGPPLNMWGAKKGYHVIAWAKDYTNLPQNALIVTDKKIQQSRDQVKRTIKGTIEALRFIQENKSEAIDILANYSRSDKATAAGMFESYFPAYSPNGNMTDAALAAALEDAVTRAKIERKIPLTQIADRTLLAEVQKEMAAEKK
jgi:ABC-type nitrate/sulfonate/bicarbonate transport system substrate-binding protein